MSQAFVYYVTRHNGLYELRQTRFREIWCQGEDHPHDVCAVARTVQELRGMVQKYFTPGSVDWSNVEGRE